MRFESALQLLLLLLLCAHNIRAFSYSCEELVYHRPGTYDDYLTHACVILPDGNTNTEQLKKFHLTPTLSFADIFRSSGHCVKKPAGVTWTQTVDEPDDCKSEFTLIMSSELPAIVQPSAEPGELELGGGSRPAVLVVPQTGMWIGKVDCVGEDNVTFSTGAGDEEPWLDLKFRSWPCHLVPARTFVFDNVLTITVDKSVLFTMHTSSYIGPYTTARSGDRFAVLSSGRSNNLQSMEGYYHQANLKMNNDYYNGTTTENFSTTYFEVQYAPKPLKPDQIYFNNDMIIVEITIGAQATIPPPVASKDEYCNCAVDKFGFPNGWRYNDIWLDVVIILDTSEAMSERALVDASSFIESLISDGTVDFLITDPTAKFYTRIGVIAVSDAAEILYNLNMTKADKVTASIKKGVKEMNFTAATTALNMFNDGLKGDPNRAGTRQVLYFLTDSNPKGDINQINQFKSSQGVVIVDNFLEEGESAIPNLKQLASDGYFFTYSNYMQGLQAFCKANCFCKSYDDSYTGSDPAIQASGGCYHSSTAGVPFSRAKSNCETDGGIIAAIHDDEKGRFVQEMMSRSSSKSDYYWIGYEKSAKGDWEWEYESTNPYTNWGPNEPSSASVAKCAYVDASTKDLTWGAANCQIGFPYVCEFAPCSVGRKSC